jgi:HEAT repeat protein
VTATSDADLGHDLARLSSRPVAERAVALTKLGWTRAGQPTPGIEPFLDDPELVVRIAAAQAHWLVNRDKGEIERLVGILAEGLESAKEDLPLAAGTALVNIGQAAVAPLIRWFEARGGSSALAVRVVGELGENEAIDFLRRTVLSDHPDIARESREALEALEEEAQWQREM